MAYETPSPITKVRKEGGLTERSDHLCERLGKIKSRLSVIIDRIIGTAPSEVGDNEVTPNNIQGNIRIAHSLVSQIDAELDRLESGL